MPKPDVLVMVPLSHLEEAKPSTSAPIRPQLLCNITHQLQLGKHLLFRHPLSTNRYTRKPTLRAHPNILHGLLHTAALPVGDDLRRFPDSALDSLGVFQLWILCSHHAEDDVLVGWEEAQWFEAAGSRVVVFEEEGVVVETLEEALGNLLVGAFAKV